MRSVSHSGGYSTVLAKTGEAGKVQLDVPVGIVRVEDYWRQWRVQGVAKGRTSNGEVV
jgi:hypothetical protein